MADKGKSENKDDGTPGLDIAAKAAEKKIASTTAAKAVAGGTAKGNAVAGAVGNAAEAVRAAKNKDSVGTVDAVARGAATGVASAVLTPAGGAAVQVVLDSKIGRKTTRSLAGIIVAVISAVMIISLTLAVATISAVMSSASQIISNSGSTETALKGVYTAGCSIILPPFVESDGTEAEEENGEDVITPEEAETLNAELRSRTYKIAGNIDMSHGEMEDFQELNCVLGVGGLASGGYVIDGIDLEQIFTDGEVVFPNTDVAIRRALMFVGNARLACDDGMCLSQCDGLAAEIWGYSNSGYLSANTHWQHAVVNGYAVPGDTNPPLGALLYWDTGHKYGHVATYVGNGMVVSNLTTSPGVSNVYLMPAAQWNRWSKYRGWSAPVFIGAQRSNTGFDR
jgi:hypothetical protein